MKSQDIIPVVLSIVVILLVAVVEKQSKLFAALTATMPLAAPLGLRYEPLVRWSRRAAQGRLPIALLVVDRSPRVIAHDLLVHPVHARIFFLQAPDKRLFESMSD